MSTSWSLAPLEQIHKRSLSRQKKMEISSANYLCPRCVEINLPAKLKERPRPVLSGIFVADLGDLQDSMKSSLCALCRLFAQVRPRTAGPFVLLAYSSRYFDIQTSHFFRYAKSNGLLKRQFLPLSTRRIGNSTNTATQSSRSGRRDLLLQLISVVLRQQQDTIS